MSRSGGERAFTRARRGEVVELEPRPVVVRRLELLASSADPPLLKIALEAAKGYYVRALARDLARALGTVGHLTELRRTLRPRMENSVLMDAPHFARQIEAATLEMRVTF